MRRGEGKGEAGEPFCFAAVGGREGLARGRV